MERYEEADPISPEDEAILDDVWQNARSLTDEERQRVIRHSKVLEDAKRGKAEVEVDGKRATLQLGVWESEDTSLRERLQSEVENLLADPPEKILTDHIVAQTIAEKLGGNILF